MCRCFNIKQIHAISNQNFIERETKFNKKMKSLSGNGNVNTYSVSEFESLLSSES